MKTQLKLFAICAIFSIISATYAESLPYLFDKPFNFFTSSYGNSISETKEDNIHSFKFYDKQSKCTLTIDFINNISIEVMYLYDNDISHSKVQQLLNLYGKQEDWISSKTATNIPTWTNYKSGIGAAALDKRGLLFMKVPSAYTNEQKEVEKIR